MVWNIKKNYIFLKIARYSLKSVIIWCKSTSPAIHIQLSNIHSPFSYQLACIKILLRCKYVYIFIFISVFRVPSCCLHVNLRNRTMSRAVNTSKHSDKTKRSIQIRQSETFRLDKEEYSDKTEWNIQIWQRGVFR